MRDTKEQPETGEAMSELLSIPVFCQRYRVSRSLTYRLMGSGAIAAVKVGRLTRIRSEDAERWVSSLSAFRGVTK
jgi:excisionase family DNA binding protein